MAMFKMFALVFLAFLINDCSCSPHHTADHSNHCHADGGDAGLLHIELGESASLPGKCQQVTCEEGFTLSAITCPVSTLPPDCKLSAMDHSKPFPDCCPTPVCKEKEKH